MNENGRGIPEAYQTWRAPKLKRKPQTMADIDRTALEIEKTNEALKRYWEKQAAREYEAAHMPWWIIAIAMLGSTLTEDESH